MRYEPGVDPKVVVTITESEAENVDGENDKVQESILEYPSAGVITAADGTVGSVAPATAGEAIAIGTVRPAASATASALPGHLAVQH